MELLRLDNIVKVYNSGKTNEVQALVDINLMVFVGEFISIVGPSGSGKSTLLNIIGGLDRPSKGNYYFNHQLLNGISEKELAQIRNANMGFIFQAFHLIPEDTVIENVMLPLIYRSGTKNEKLTRALEIIDKLQLTGRKNHKAIELSGGEMQRVAIARALIKKPKIIFADEPTGNLDYQSKIATIELLKQLNSEEKITIFLVTHDHMLMQYATRKIMLNGGRIVDQENLFFN
jgi:putative ABC transport system ATP-binding protein